MKENILNKEIIIWSAALALILAILLDYMWLSILFLLLAGSIFFYKERAIIFLSIVAFLVLVSDIDQKIRLVVNISCIFSLLFIFIKNYGINFKGYPKLPKELTCFVSFFYLSMILSTLFSAYIFDGVQQILQTTVFFIIVYILYSFLRDAKDIYLYFYALLISALIIVTSIIIVFFSGNYNLIDLVAASQLRTTGILSNVNAPGGIAIAVLPILASLMFFKGFKNRLLIISVFFLILFGIFLTTSRSALLGIFASALFILLYFYRLKFLKYCSLLILILIVLYLIPAVNDSVNLFFRIESGLSQRGYLWDISINIIKDNPVFGIGPGAYSRVMLNYFPVMFDTFVGQELVALKELTIGTNDSHNFFLYYFSDMGIFGLASSFIITAIFFAVANKTINIYKAGKSIYFYLAVGITAAGVGLFVRGMFEGIGILTYGWIKVDLPFWLIFALLIFLFQNKKELVRIK
ncbi:MAG: O-antigen ligase family protein [Ignavibacteria bacterium]